MMCRYFLFNLDFYCIDVVLMWCYNWKPEAKPLLLKNETWLPFVRCVFFDAAM